MNRTYSTENKNLAYKLNKEHYPGTIVAFPGSENLQIQFKNDTFRISFIELMPQ